MTSKKKRKRLPGTTDAFRQRLLDNLYHTHGQAVQTASERDAYMALCYTVRNLLTEHWAEDGRRLTSPPTRSSCIICRR